MIIKGIDFTSSPTQRKPITCAICSLKGTRLTLLKLKYLSNFTLFEEEIAETGEWAAGCDFPFGQSRTFLQNMSWPENWIDYIRLCSSFSKHEFVELLEDYKKDRKSGDKEHKRMTDKVVMSISPQKIYGVPVGKMFFEGTKRLLASPASIFPFRIHDKSKMIYETYPALIARICVDKRSYKNDQKSRQTKELERVIY